MEDLILPSLMNKGITFFGFKFMNNRNNAGLCRQNITLMVVTKSNYEKL